MTTRSDYLLLCATFGWILAGCQEESFDEMVFVPGGEFTLGSSEAEIDSLFTEYPRAKSRPRNILNQTPAHVVKLDAFYIDRYEVTNAQFNRFLEAVEKSGVHSFCHPGEPEGKVHRPLFLTDLRFGRPNYPVVGVDWYDAYAYAKWAGKRLPTEAEWEKAARGDAGLNYPWGNEWQSNRGNFGLKTDRFNSTSPVDAFVDGQSVYGCFNMAGNVMEWTSSVYREYPFVADDGIKVQNSDEGRVLRGASFTDVHGFLARSVYRRKMAPDYAIPMRNVGFRCAVTAVK